MRASAILVLALAALLPGTFAAASPDEERPGPDADGDGLSDFQEAHKYLTDPAKADSDGDGIPDGDWSERREFTYTMRFIVRAMPPATALSDDRQDARLLDRCADCVELEIVGYPFADHDADIPRTRDRERAAAAMPQHVAPNLTCNFDAAMQKQLLADLKTDGIDAAELSDRDLVESVTKWAMKGSQFEESGFCAQIVSEVGGKVRPVPGLEDVFRRRKQSSDPKRSDEEQLGREVLGKQMYARRRHGACTSSAVYLATILRALGVPTRQTLAMPPADASDPKQVAILAQGLRQPEIRGQLLEAMRKLGASNASHNFDLVFVGGRWRRLNYSDLGPKFVDPNYMGVLLRLVEFDDLSTSGIAPTWGRFGAVGPRTHDFPGPNPYRLVDATDRLGVHAKKRVAIDEGGAGPAAPREHESLTIVDLSWKLDPNDPKKLLVNRDCNILLCRVKEWFDDQDAGQYTRFTERADREFVLVDAKGTSYSAKCRIGCEVGENLRAVWIAVPLSIAAHIPSRAALRLVPRNGSKGPRWSIEANATLSMP